MLEGTLHKSQLELKVQKFFEHDSELSDSDESLERTRSLSNNKKYEKNQKKTRSQKELKQLTRTSSRKSKLTTRTKIETAKTIKTPSSRDRSLSQKEETVVFTKISRATDRPSNVSTLKDNYALRMKINDLNKTLSKKNRQIKRLYYNVYLEKEEIRQLTIRASDLSRRDKIIQEYQEKVCLLQENEAILIQEVTSQQKIAKNALAKLHEIQEESIRQVSNAKEYYKNFYSQQVNEIKRQLEERIDLITKEKDAIISTLKSIENSKETERNNQISLLNKEISNLQDQVKRQESELEELRNENKQLLYKLREQKDSSANEKNVLKDKIEELIHHSKVQKYHEDENLMKDTSERSRLYEIIETLQREISEKDKAILLKDREHREQAELISSKLETFQRELRKMGEYEMRIETLQKELSVKEDELNLAKEYYKEKLSANKKANNQQKMEWSTIYSEMLEEIKSLRLEIDLLGTENKKLLASFTHIHQGI